MASKPRVVWMLGGVRIEIQLGGEETGGRFCLLADWLPVGWSLPAHLHPEADETMHVLKEEFEMELGGKHTKLGAWRASGASPSPPRSPLSAPG